MRGLVATEPIGGAPIDVTYRIVTDAIGSKDVTGKISSGGGPGSNFKLWDLPAIM
jgi:hypothetical protein